MSEVSCVWQDEKTSNHIFIGSEVDAKELKTMHSLGIEYIVCLGSEPVYPSSFKYLRFPDMLDVPSQCLTQIAHEACFFIAAGLQHSNVMVHCIHGSSRSPAVVAAFLIQTTNYSLENIVRLLQEKRKIVSINEGFVAQLDLLQSAKISAKVLSPDASSTLRWFHFASTGRIVGAVSDERKGAKVTCKMCRQLLFHSSNIIEHTHRIVDIMARRSTYVIKNLVERREWRDCKSLFIEPMAWCLICAQTNEQKLECPGNCRSKLGRISVSKGIICDCGQLVIPAFQILKSKVDIKYF